MGFARNRRRVRDAEVAPGHSTAGTRVALRLATGIAAIGAAVAIAATPAHASGVFVEVNPSTIQAGFQVAIRASCGDNLNPATVTSDAFGTVTVQPVNAFLTAAATIPADTRPRGYTVKLKCHNGQTATTTLWVIGMPTHHKGPNTGGGGMASGSGTGLIAGGAAVIVAGAGLAMLARRRRA